MLWLNRCMIRALAVLLALAASAPLAPSSVEARPGGAAAVRTENQAPQRCCFTNQRFAGTCMVEPEKDETCGQILDYLNNPMSSGKSYCGNSPIRGGWKSVACEPSR
jgi:hypothetical protein